MILPPNWRTSVVPDSSCPNCGAEFTQATNQKGRMPKPNDATVCIKCATILVFTDQLTVRAPTTEELDKLSREPELQRIVQAVAAIHRKQ